MRFGVERKIGAMAIAFLVFIAVGVIMTIRTLSGQEGDSAIINIAGGQRMLSQKMTKEAFAVIQGSAVEDQLEQTISDFDQNLTDLIRGNEALDIPAADDDRLIGQLNSVSRLWEPFKEEITAVVEIGPTFRSSLQYVVNESARFVDEMDEAVTAYAGSGASGTVVNIAGRQRMLLERLNKQILSFGTRATAVQEAQATRDLFVQSMNGLINGSAALNLPPTTNATARARMRTVENTWATYGARVDDLLELGPRLQDHRSFLEANNLPLMQTMNTAVGTFEVVAREKTQTLQGVQQILLIAGVLLTGIVLVVVRRVIATPLRTVTDLVSRIAEGDLRRQSDYYAADDEIGDLSNASQTLLERLSEVISQVTDGAESVNSAAQQMSGAASSLSQGTSEQAASVEETTASLEEMNASIGSNADNSRQTEQIANDNSSRAEESGKAVTETVDAMKSIAQKVTIVEEIAYQTNLLALNAAIEAARAGEHGKGFAVVATEVRKLAERSQSAAKEIGELATNSVKVAEHTGSLLTELLPQIQKTAGLVQEVAAASGEQASGVEQINNALSQMDNVTQRNASSAEELASTSEELEAQAQSLKELMGYFRIDAGTGGFTRARTTSALGRGPGKDPVVSKTIGSGDQSGQSGSLKSEATDRNFQQF
ncbi:MAG: methyl-accepting chemotaxis protein [Gemmatimonadota bacterium]|nr:methyl-accepting chemotaxis protein [Gemmatimonadota bacterium]MDH5804236.1 methyl-accepting chemotaxis protein [Gemmatimonadota bacterium]